MSSPYLKYRTFDQLLSDVVVDLPTQNKEGFIEPAQLIKIAITANYKLGLKIQEEKEAILEVTRNKARLPENFHTLNYAKVCLHYTVEQEPIHGTHTEDVILDEPVDPCQDGVRLICDGRSVIVKETKLGKTRIYDEFADIRLKINNEVPLSCPNTRCISQLEGQIRHGFLHTNFESANVYIHYMGNMEDEDGNLLVPDHPVLNEYYEYALKQRILENMLMAGENVATQLQLVEARFRDAKNAAMTLVNTPDFAEMQKVWDMNRQAQLKRFYSMFM